MTTASASGQVPFPRARVWRALAVLQPYCAVCDVSYLVEGGETREGTVFVCEPGKSDGRAPRPGAPRGEIIEWSSERRVATRLELTPEAWTTTIDLTDGTEGGTQVTITLTHEPRGGRWLSRRLGRAKIRKLVQRTAEDELAKVPDHVRQADELPSG